MIAGSWTQHFLFRLSQNKLGAQIFLYALRLITEFRLQKMNALYSYGLCPNTVYNPAAEQCENFIPHHS